VLLEITWGEAFFYPFYTQLTHESEAPDVWADGPILLRPPGRDADHESNRKLKSARIMPNYRSGSQKNVHVVGAFSQPESFLWSRHHYH